MAMISVDEALDRILARIYPLQGRCIPGEQAGGLLLTKDVIARLTQPPFAASAMDGYALRAADVKQSPARLAVIGEVAAGTLFDKITGGGQCVRIFTGAPVPHDIDTVVRQEDVRRLGDTFVELVLPVEGGQNIRPLGGDFKKGDPVLTTGQRLTPSALALIAAAGVDRVEVMPRPRVGILSTGDELVEAGREPAPGQIIASNAHALAEIVRLHGGEAVDLGLVGDNRLALATAIDRAKAARIDILVTSGGVSVGDYDLVQESLKEAAMQLDFWQIAMRPGKPLMFGILPASPDIPVLGLPGNPVSSIVTAHLFLVPVLEKMQNRPHSFTLTSARLQEPLKANGTRRHYLRATIEKRSEKGKESQIWVRPAPSADSSLLSVLAHADCLIVMEAGAPAQDAGSSCQIFIPPYGL